MATPELNLLDYWRIIRKRKLIILLIIVVSAGIAWFYASQQPPIYQARTRIMIEEARSVATGGELDFFYSETDFISTQSELIKSRKVAEKAAVILNWVNQDMPQKERDLVIGKIQSSISTMREGSTNLVDIISTTDDPNKAVEIANAVAKGYQQFSFEERTSQARRTREFIGEQLKEVEKRLREKEEALKNFRSRSERSGELSAMRTTLVQWESELDVLLERYTELHPDVREKRRQISGLRDRLGQYPELEMELNQLERAIETHANLYDVLKQRYEESRINEADTASGVSIVSRAAGASTIASKKFLNTALGGLVGLFLGLVFAFVKENLDTSIGTIEEIESFLQLPVLGVIPQIIPEGEKSSIGHWYDFIWPKKSDKMKGEEVRELLNLESDGQSIAAEAYKTLRTNLNYACKEKGFKVLVITSSGSQEGKTITSTNCALALAQNGQKVLLISADLRRGMVHHLFGLDREPGLFDILTRDADPDKVIRGFTDLLMGDLPSEKLLQTSGIDNLSVLTEGRMPSNPAELLGSKRMEELLQKMKEKYDYVLVDCPPVLPVADALLLSPKADGVIMVYHSGKTARGALKRAKVQLNSVHANIVGVILNNIKAAELKMGPSYYYYYGYGYGYHTEDKAKSKGRKISKNKMVSDTKSKNNDQRSSETKG